jgi:hypothetical protein
MAEENENVEVVEETGESSIADDIRNVIETLEGDEPAGGESQEVAGPPSDEAEAAAPQETQEEVQPQEGTEVPESQPKPTHKPPLDWSPQLKEEFGNLPEPVQKAIHEREVTVANLFQNLSQDRRVAHDFNNIVSEFSGLMAAEGVQDPMQGVRGLLVTTAQLAMGNKASKAQKIADLIRHYDVDIESLDQVLSGEALPQQEAQPVSDPRLDYVFNRMQQAEQSSQQHMIYDAQQSIEQFGSDPKNEFFDNVRYDMADFLDVAAQHGQQMTLEEAYDRACALNPDISAVIAQRRAQEQGQTAQAALKNKTNAAASISGVAGRAQPMGDPPEGGSIREILESQIGGEGRI